MRPIPHLAALLMAMTAMACAGGGGRVVRAPGTPPPAADDAAPRSPLEGEWTLVGLETASGPRRATGFLRFDRFHNISVHVELAGDDPASTPPRTVVANFTAKAEPQGNQLDYTGLQVGVGTERLAPEAAPMAAWTRYEITGDTLRLSAGSGNATLVFRRTG